MRNSLKILILLLIPILSKAQQYYVDSLKNILKTTKADSTHYSALNGIGEFYVEINADSAISYLDRAYVVAKKNDMHLNMAATVARKGYALLAQGKYPESFLCFQQALDLASDPGTGDAIWNTNMSWLARSTPNKNRLTIISGIHLLYSFLMQATGDHKQYVAQLKLSRKYATAARNIGMMGVVKMNLGAAYFSENRVDSALIFEKDAERIAKQTGYIKYLAFIEDALGVAYFRKGDHALAIQYFHRALNTSLQQNASLLADQAYNSLANYYLTTRQKDSSLYYATKRLNLVRLLKSNELDGAYQQVCQSYQLANNIDSAYKYQGLALAAKAINDNATIKNLTDFKNLSMKQQLSLQQQEKETEDAETRIRMYALLFIIVVILIVAFFIYRNSRHRKKANYLLREQKEEIATQRDNLGQALEELKTTQTQLVQREKMASLGELTAGIAHEIQNPLNFVNNFSEVNTELIDELQEEIDKGDLEEVKAIANDIKDNQQKISQHGKRADFIVKGMLQHSRTSTGEKQLTNINVLADEFLKLSYHGLRAKDKTFNAELVTHFDKGLPQLTISQQDIGRVLLNLFNNAFYAVNQKSKTAGAAYSPTVEISTSSKNGWAEIKVKDNGNGIPDAIKDKIMQPFFTTKPTGEGTGLGLSLSYDIVVKGHGGYIDFTTKAGEGSEFIVKLQVNG